jgi:hypothetical protein
MRKSTLLANGERIARIDMLGPMRIRDRLVLGVDSAFLMASSGSDLLLTFCHTHTLDRQQRPEAVVHHVNSSNSSSVRSAPDSHHAAADNLESDTVPIAI